MQDLQTGSLWSQPSGECIRGDMESSRLTLFPAIHTTYEEFRKMYPGGLLLVKEEKGSHGSPYDSYFADQQKLGIFGRVDSFRRLPGKQKVFGLRLEGYDLAVSLDHLKENGFVLLDDASPPVIVTYDKSGKTASAYAVPLDGEDAGSGLIVADGKISVIGSDVVWDAATGRVEAGTVADLEAVPILTSYWFAWASFFPDTRLLK